MTNANVERDNYILLVMECIPADVPDRAEIERDIRAVIAERQAAGEALRDILDNLGRPLELAESYLEDEPMESGGIGARIMARVIDLGIPYAIFFYLLIHSLIAQFAQLASPDAAMTSVLVMLSWAFLVVLFVALPVYSEWRWGQTPGKYFMGLRVVRVSGAKISFGQALMRQIPAWFQFLWIDALFALFTPLRQRAFEKLSETRVIRNR